MKKQNLKKGLSLLLAIVMVLGMLPFSAFAQSGSQWQIGQYHALNESDQIIPGTATDDPAQTVSNGAVTLSKVITPTSTENLFNIALNITTVENVEEIKASSDASVVLVLDVSNSMLDTISGSSTTDNSKRRITQAKNAAKDFVDQFAKDALNSDGTTAKRPVAVVIFGRNAMTVQPWLDVSVPANADTVKKAIEDKVATGFTYSGNSDSGATNIEAGLMLARNLLGQSEPQGVASSNVILLTDGKPTAYVNGNSTSTTGISGSGDGTDTDASDYEDVPAIAAQIRELANLYSVAYTAGSQTLFKEYLPKTFACTATGWHQQHTVSYDFGRGTTGALQNGKFKECDHWLFCDCTRGWFNGPHSETVTDRVNVSVGEWLNRMSSGYYPADSDAELSFSFSQISQIIKLLAEAWRVDDPMGAYTSFVGFTGSSSSRPADVLAEIDGTITWDLKKDSPVVQETDKGKTYTYTTTYQVRLTPEMEGFEEKTFYPTNKTTTLTYVLTKDGEIEPVKHTANFLVPTVQGTVPTFDYRIEFYKLPPNTEPGTNYANYALQERDTKPGSAKAWTVVDAITEGSLGYQSNYLTKYQSNRDITYEYVGGTTRMTLGAGENVLKLYYAPVQTKATVNHYYRETYFDEGGTLVTPDYPEKPGTIVTVPGEGAPASQWLYVNGKYTAAPITDGGYTLDTEKSDNRTIDPLSQNNNIIDLYYTRDKQTADATVSVYHVYDTERWELQNGQYTKVVDEGEETLVSGPISTISGAKYPVSLTPKQAGALYQDFTVNKNQSTSATDATLTVDLASGENKIVLTYLTPASDEPNAPRVSVTVTHHYTKDVVLVEDGVANRYTDAHKDVSDTYEQRQDGTYYYAGETFTAVSQPEPDGDGPYTPQFKDEDLSITLVALQGNAPNALTLNYDWSAAPQQQEASVTHIYRTFKTVEKTEPVLDEFGEPTYDEFGEPIVTVVGTEEVEDLGARITDGPKAQPYYVGEKFSPAEVGLTGYTYQESEPYRQMFVGQDDQNPGNHITHYYDKDDVTEGRVPADIKVQHTYTTNLKSVYEGVVDTRPHQDHVTSLEPTEMAGDDILVGHAGDLFTPTEKANYNGLEYTLIDADRSKLQEHILQPSTNSTIELHYQRADSTLEDSAGLIVNYHYADLKMFIDADGQPKYPDPSDRSLYTKDEAASGAVTLQSPYVGVKVDIVPWSGATGYTSDSGNLKLVYLAGNQTTVDLYYYKFIDLPEVKVTVQHYDTKTTIDTVGGTSTEGPTLRNPESTPTPLRVGQTGTANIQENGNYKYNSFTPPAAPPAFDYTQDDTTKAVTFTAPETNITLRFDYLWTDDNSVSASYKVNYYYKSVDWNQKPEEVSYPTDPTNSIPYGGLYATNLVSAAPIYRTDTDGAPIGDVLDKVESSPVYTELDDEYYQIELAGGDGNEINFYLYNRYDSRVHTPVNVNYVYETYDTATQRVIHSVGFTDSAWTKDDGAWAGNDFSVGTRNGDGSFTVAPKFDKPTYTFVTDEGENPVTYKFHAVDPEEGSIRVTAMARALGENTIQLTYRLTPTTTTYVVQHEYYYDGARRGGTQSAPVAGDVGQVIRATDLTAERTYDGVTYGAPTASVGELPLSADTTLNVITLTYRYTPTNVPLGPPEEEIYEREERPDPPVVIPEEPLPLAPQPPVTPEPPEVTIDEPETPLAPAPDEEFVIVEEEVPLGNLPQTGSVVDPTETVGRLALMASLSAAGLAYLIGRRKDEENA